MELVTPLLRFRSTDPTILNKSKQTATELALITQNGFVRSVILSHSVARFQKMIR